MIPQFPMPNLLPFRMKEFKDELRLQRSVGGTGNPGYLKLTPFGVLVGHSKHRILISKFWSKNMAFVNEYISVDDIVKYDIENILRRFSKRLIGRWSWTIDRERDVVLMWIRRGLEEESDHVEFVLWWRKQLIEVELITVEEGGSYSAKSYIRWGLGAIKLPSGLESQRSDILEVLKEALIEYMAFGIGVPVTDHTVSFDF